jgi:hypothetical protein
LAEACGRKSVRKGAFILQRSDVIVLAGNEMKRHDRLEEGLVNTVYIKDMLRKHITEIQIWNFVPKVLRSLAFFPCLGDFYISKQFGHEKHIIDLSICEESVVTTVLFENHLPHVAAKDC